MVDFVTFLPYLALMAGVTYLVRMLPLVLVRKKFENRFIRSFLYYVPYVVLGVMTVPAVLYSSESMVASAAGFAVALILAYFERSLITVSASACCAVFLTDMIMKFL